MLLWTTIRSWAPWLLLRRLTRGVVEVDTAEGARALIDVGVGEGLHARLARGDAYRGREQIDLALHGDVRRGARALAGSALASSLALAVAAACFAMHEDEAMLFSRVDCCFWRIDPSPRHRLAIAERDDPWFAGPTFCDRDLRRCRTFAETVVAARATEAGEPERIAHYYDLTHAVYAIQLACRRGDDVACKDAPFVRAANRESGLAGMAFRCIAEEGEPSFCAWLAAR